MNLRKINAVFGLLATVLLLGHSISLAVWMLSQGAVPKAPEAMPRALTFVFVIHIILSIVLIISTNKGRKKSSGKHYFKLNRATLFQRISGILLIIFTPPHILGATGVIQPAPLVHATLPVMFFCLSMAHAAVSADKALITLGIGHATFVKRAGIAIKVICATTLVADIIGFYLYVC